MSVLITTLPFFLQYAAFMSELRNKARMLVKKKKLFRDKDADTLDNLALLCLLSFILPAASLPR